MLLAVLRGLFSVGLTGFDRLEFSLFHPDFMAV